MIALYSLYYNYELSIDHHAYCDDHHTAAHIVQSSTLLVHIVH